MSSIEEYRTTCPFCPVHDKLILKRKPSNNAVFRKSNLFGLYYDKKNDRGLCARGNFTLELLNSPYRNRNVKVKGKQISLDRAIKKCSSKLKNISKERNKVAILIGGNHTLEEGYLVKDLSEELNTELIGLFPFEDEALLSVKNDFSFEDLKEADLIFSVGDVFSHSPTLAKSILDARNKKRGNRLLALDIIRGRISPFAESYITPPGSIAYFLWNFLRYLDNRENFELEKTALGLPAKALEEIAGSLLKCKNGWILFSNIYGHFSSPYTIVFLLEKIARKTGNHFAVLPVGQNTLGIGRIIGKFNNSTIINRLKNGDLKGLLTLGANPFELIPGFEDISSNLDFILSTAFFSSEDFPGYLFPSTFSFEKEGSVISLEEEIETLGEAVPPVGDAISDGNLISKLLYEISGKEVKAKVLPIKPLEWKEVKEPMVPSSLADKKFPFIILGFGLPFHHGDGEITRRMNWNKKRGGPYLFINPTQLKDLGLGKKVRVVTPYSSSEFKIGNINELPFDIPKSVLAVPTHYPESRKLFGFEQDRDGFISPGALRARLE